MDRCARCREESVAKGCAEAGQVQAGEWRRREGCAGSGSSRAGGCVMELKVTTLEGKAAGSVQLSDEIFGLEPRKDIIARCVQWQLNKRQAGTHKTQGRADVWRTGKKMYKQKGTGGARHGSARGPQVRGGGPAFGPGVRSHATDLPKKVPALALRHPLSPKAKDGGLGVIESAKLEAPQTKWLVCAFSGFR